MSKERTVITQALCDHVKALLAGGLTNKQAANFVKVGEATVSRIKKAGFNAMKYAADTDRRRIEERRNKAEKTFDELHKYNEGEPMKPEVDVSQECPGQLKMDIQEIGDIPMPITFENRMMRFHAAQTQKLLDKLDRISDQLGQILRRADNGH